MSDIAPITMQVVINTRFGGYGLSRAASLAVAERKGLTLREEHGDNLCVGDTWDSVAQYVSRNDPDLIAVVRELGDAANGAGAKLKIVNVSIGIDIENYDGKESVTVSGGAYV